MRGRRGQGARKRGAGRKSGTRVRRPAARGTRGSRSRAPPPGSRSRARPRRGTSARRAPLPGPRQTRRAGPRPPGAGRGRSRRRRPCEGSRRMCGRTPDASRGTGRPARGTRPGRRPCRSGLRSGGTRPRLAAEEGARSARWPPAANDGQEPFSRRTTSRTSIWVNAWWSGSRPSGCSSARNHSACTVVIPSSPATRMSS